MTDTAPISVTRLTDDLRRLGVGDGDTLMVHASLRAIGPVVRGADGVLDAIESAVGPDGTVLMLLVPLIEHDWVNERPNDEREALLADVVPYDPAAAPAVSDVSYLAEVFRRRRGTRVTAHPSGRFGARGRRADELLRGQRWDDYYGPGSPLEQLCDVGGNVLRLGADPATTTVLHYAEYLADVPDKRRVRRHYRVLGAKGPEVRAVESLDNETGIADWRGEDYFAVILKAYVAAGRARLGNVGRAASALIDAGDIVAFGTRWMNRNLGGTGHGGSNT